MKTAIIIMTINVFVLGFACGVFLERRSTNHNPIKLNLRLNRGVLYLNGKLILPDSIDTLQPIKNQPTKREITYYSTLIYR